MAKNVIMERNDKMTLEDLTANYSVYTTYHKLEIDIENGVVAVLETGEDDETTKTDCHLGISSFAATRLSILFKEMAKNLAIAEEERRLHRVEVRKKEVAKEAAKEKAKKSKTVKKKAVKKKVAKKK